MPSAGPAHRGRPRETADAALQPAHRAGLCQLDSPFHGQPSTWRSARGSQGRPRRCIPEPAGQRQACRRLHAEPGLQRALVPVSWGPEAPTRGPRRHSSSQAARACPTGPRSCRDRSPVRADAGSRMADGLPDVRQRPTPSGVLPAPGQGHRLRPWRDHDPRWQGRQGSRDVIAGTPERAPAPAAGRSSRSICRRPTRRMRWRRTAPRSRGAATERLPRLGLAMGLPRASAPPRRAGRPAKAPSRQPVGGSARLQGSAAPFGHPQARQLPHPAIRSQLISSRMATTSGRFRSCLATAPSARP